MIQFNLLPDIKTEYIKARKAKRAVIVISVLAVAISISILIIMVSATLFQKRHISDLNKEIQGYETSLVNTQDLAKILTIQNQLDTLPSLYTQRPVTSRLFGYVEATTPKEITISNLDIDFAAFKMSVDGTADSLESVNRYVDTLKFTTYTAVDTDAAKDAFSQVVLTTFNRTTLQASFTIKMNFDTVIFDSTQSIKLNVPKTITTRSQTELPTGVFDTKEEN